VAAVLAVAHERGVVHRDIKPQNVMITGDGTAKILDFGVAGIVSQRITSTGIAVGTPAYMAPEQLNNQPATARTDLYALGCLLYEMLSGQPVFTATSPAALMRMHLEQAPPPLRRADLDVSLVQLVWQLLQKDPLWRPSGAREVYDRLLPYVRPAGALGDINPGAGAGLGSGMQLYSRLLVQLTGGSPAPGHGAPLARPAVASPGGPWTPMTAAVPASPRPGRAFRHSLWILPAIVPLGMGAWLSFGYIGIRHRRARWLVAGAVYLGLMIAWISLLATAPATGNWPVTANAGLIIAVALWPAGFVHALWVNFSARLPLVAAGGKR
jgi:hypothetical protein